MDIVNRRQPVDSREDLFPKSASDKIKKLVKSSKTCFICTNIKQNKPFDILPIQVHRIDNQGNIWFSGSPGSKTKNVFTDDIYVQLLFQGDAFSNFLSLFGTVTKHKYPLKNSGKENKRLLKKDLKDHSLNQLKFEPLEGYYWNTKLKKVSTLLKRKDTKGRKTSGDFSGRKLSTG